MGQKVVKSFDIAVVGGGAAGLAGAVAAKSGGLSRLALGIFEVQSRVGKKLIATGNGRCNYTNTQAEVANYHGNDPSFTAFALSAFSPQSNLDFFENMGIYPRFEEDGKVYPFSNQASSLVDVLRLTADNLGVEILNDCEVESIKPHDSGFCLQTSCGYYYSKKVILACGGMAGSGLGGSGRGYVLAQSLGHSLTEISPALVQIKTEKVLPNSLKGLKFQGVAALKSNGKILAQTKGEILFAEYGLSGPAILDLSCALPGELLQGLSVELDFFPDFSLVELGQILAKRRNCLGHLTLENYLTGFMNKKIGQLLVKRILGKQLSFSVGDLHDADLDSIAKGLKCVELPYQGVTGWKNAQVTAGGISVDEICTETMESKVQPGLYIVGEMLDVFGDCGGFNLQWAWSSGRLGAESALKALGVNNAEN